MKERHWGFLNLILFAILLVLALIFRDWKNANLLWSGTFGALIALFLSLGSWMLISRKNLKTICSAFFVKKLRISCSYLYKIKVDDSYLLVKSKKHKKYQPVGGNFKRNKYSNAFLQSVILEEDEAFTNGGRSADDLRFFIKGRNLQKYLKWYNAPDKQREVGYNREFYEELVEPGFLSGKIFPFPKIDFRKQIVTPVSYSEHLKCKEVHIYDIVELSLSSEQEEFIRELSNKGSTDDFIWVNATIISSEGYHQATKNSPFQITDHSKEILV